MNKSTEDLRKLYPEFNLPIRCENGCGVVIELIAGFRSYRRGDNGEHLIICECCASEDGHADEDYEDHDMGPTCKRPTKKHS